MEKLKYRVLGVMSGTSLDGIDLALVEFTTDNQWQYEIILAETIAYSEEWKNQLANAVHYSEDQLQDLNKNYTGFLAEVISDFVRNKSIEGLDAVCSHGHTIKHEPQNAYTLQIGNLPELAELLKLPVVCDFRVQDVEMGGQGAPLVPLGDELLFGEYEYCLNLGGFANVSTRRNGERIAYDICAVNTVMNFLAEKLDLPYDENGEIAASGKPDPELLLELNSLEYYRLDPPKSLGIEWVNQHILPLLKDKRDIASTLHTFAVHAAEQIARSFDDNPNSRVLVTGGGTFNSFLMENIRSVTRNKIWIPSPEVVNFKEALIFGFLGVLRLRNEINVLSSVTGATADHSSGKVFVPK